MSTRSAIVVAALLYTGIAAEAVGAEPGSDRTMAAFYYGRGANTNGYGIQGVWPLPCECALLKRYGFEPLIGVNLAYWDGLQPDNAHPSLWDVGAHGYLRYLWHPNALIEPMIETGLGVHALSEKQINNNREFGTWFQFGSRIGAGIAFNTARRVEVIAFIKHISNARLASPNDGITFRGIEIRVALP